MTDHERAFIQTIIADPEDDTPRLVFADWLEEQGRSERSEFIRVQSELAKYKSNRCPNRQDRKSPQTLLGYPVIIKGENCGRCRWCQLDRRVKELRSSLDWTAIFRREFPVLFEMAHYIDSDNPAVEWRRGFIAEITLTCADWLQYRERLLKAAPLEKVTLTHCRYTMRPRAEKDRYKTRFESDLGIELPVYRMIMSLWVCPDFGSGETITFDVRQGNLFLENHAETEVFLITFQEFNILWGYPTSLAPQGIINHPG